MSFDIARLERRIAALEANRGASLRFGTVTEVNAEAGSARVQLPDGGNMVSMPLRVLQERTLKDKRQMLPDLGEPVAALFSGQGLEQGVILGAHYSTKTPPPGQPANIDYTRYEDGTEIAYDREAHKLTAKVKGDAEIETEGLVCVRAAQDILAEASHTITLKAPRINLAGKLSVTGKDGRPGSGDLFGDYRVINGSFDVPDGDVIAGVTRLRSHLHDGVERGPSNTNIPVNGSQNGDSGLTEDDLRELVFGTQTEHTNLLIRCLPEIAIAEAERCQKQGNERDRRGWFYFHDMISKWLHGKGAAMPDDKYHNGCQSPYIVEWDWLMQYERFRQAVQTMTNPSYLFSRAAQGKLVDILVREGAFSEKGRPFDHINLVNFDQEWHLLRGKAFQSCPMTITPAEYPGILDPIAQANNQIKPDAMQAVLASTTLYAVARGRTERQSQGTWNIIVQEVALFIHDGFDFNGEQYLGQWFCSVKNKSFDMTGAPLGNREFRLFRDMTGYGCDFRTMCKPEIVIQKEFSYGTDSSE